MSGNEKNIIVSLRNQVLAIAVTTCLGGLGMNFVFMFTINNTVKDLRNENARLQIQLNTSNDKLESKIENLQTLVYNLKP